MTDNPPAPAPPNRIEDRAPKPLGVIPKHVQSLVIMGVAVAMILIMWLTGNSRKAAPLRPVTIPTPPVSPTDASKVQDFKQAIQSEQQAVRRAVPSPGETPADAFGIPGVPGLTGGPNANPSQPWGQVPPGAAQAFSGGAPSPPTYQPGQPGEAVPAGAAAAEDPVKAEKKKRQYLSLFASNVALSYRPGEEAQKLMGVASNASGPASSTPSPDPEADYLRQLQALSAVPAVPPAPQAAPAPDKAAESSGSVAKPVNPSHGEEEAFNQAVGKKYVIFEGTVIETVLINRLEGGFAGPVNCLVTSHVYSHDRQHVLIPAGSKVLGEAGKVNTFGQQRLAVAFHRLIMPDGYSVSLDQVKGLDQIGATALRDKVNNHYLKIFGASMAIGILGGIAEAGTGNVYDQSAFDRIRVGFGQSTALAGMQVLDRFLNILPTITIREGQRVKVYLSGDLLLPDYTQHTMDSDL
ncbi:MAG TPA: TrbI/VirB10 family protein [Terriglobia bacterium]